jgi:hypothetical protein
VMNKGDTLAAVAQPADALANLFEEVGFAHLIVRSWSG